MRVKKKCPFCKTVDTVEKKTGMVHGRKTFWYEGGHICPKLKDISAHIPFK